MEFEIEVTITKKVEHRDIWSCLVGAFEGGSSYWARSDVSDYNGLTRINHGDPLMKEENERRLKEHTEKTGETYLPFRMKCEDDFEWLAENKRYIYTHQIPFLGGEVTIYDLESREWSEEEEEFVYTSKLGVVNLETIESGLGDMYQNSQRHFMDFIEERGDAITSDVLLQYITMGKIVFG